MQNTSVDWTRLVLEVWVGYFCKLPDVTEWAESDQKVQLEQMALSPDGLFLAGYFRTANSEASFESYDRVGKDWRQRSATAVSFLGDLCKLSYYLFLYAILAITCGFIPNKRRL